jgi:uncharacterized protein
LTVPGETDLQAMLDSLDVSRRPGTFTFATGVDQQFRADAVAIVEEAEGTTLVLPVDVARRAGIEVGFEAAWLTLTVVSALEAVGLTAAVSRALADADIPCNMLAGFHHDHLLVPVDRADDAMACVRGLSSR